MKDGQFGTVAEGWLVKNLANTLVTNPAGVPGRRTGDGRRILAGRVSWEAQTHAGVLARKLGESTVSDNSQWSLAPEATENISSFPLPLECVAARANESGE
jgi:hypothetical protein